MKYTGLLLVLILGLVWAETKVSFRNHRVVRLNIHNASELELVNSLVEKHYLDVWSDKLNDIRLAPEHHDLFTKHGIEHKIWIPDVQKLIDNFEAEHALRAPGAFFDTFRKTDEVMAWVNDLKTQYPDLVTTEVLGKTTLGKDIVAVHVQNKKGPAEKPRIVFNSCQHAREWITVTTNNWVLNELLTRYGKNETITKLVDDMDWTFVPITNIDGYDYTWTTNRMWRKTRNTNTGSSCMGVDPNRNWNYQWNKGGSSSDPCSDIYHGPRAGSQPEPLAIANYITNTPRVAGYMDIHSYSQLLMSPWGYSYSYPNDYEEMVAAMKPMVDTIKSVHGKTYREGTIANILYVASGSAVDYGYGHVGIVHTYTIELRDTGQYGFVLPANQIKPQGEEWMEGAIVMAEHVMKKYYAEH